MNGQNTESFEDRVARVASKVEARSLAGDAMSIIRGYETIINNFDRSLFNMADSFKKAKREVEALHEYSGEDKAFAVSRDKLKDISDQMVEFKKSVDSFVKETRNAIK